jgi:hypothetical protein
MEAEDNQDVEDEEISNVQEEDELEDEGDLVNSEAEPVEQR